MKITDLRKGEEYAARLYPKHPDTVSHIRLLGTRKTEPYTYYAGWGGDRKDTVGLPAMSIQGDGTEVRRAVLPKHIFATWAEYKPTYDAIQAEKNRGEMFRAQAEEAITVRDVGSSVVVVSHEHKVAEFLYMGRVADKPTMTKAAEDYAKLLRRRFVQLAMGTLKEGASA